MALLAIFIAVLIGVPLILSLISVLLLIPTVAIFGIIFLLFKLIHFIKSHSSRNNSRNRNLHHQFRLRQNMPPWARNVRTT